MSWQVESEDQASLAFDTETASAASSLLTASALERRDIWRYIQNTEVAAD